MTGDRVIIITIVLKNDRSVAVGVDIVGAKVGVQQGRLNKLRILNDDGFIYVDQRGGWQGIRKNAWWRWRE